MGSPWILRPATASDATVIAEFNQALARETEERHLPDHHVLPGVSALLADPAKGRYFVAEADGRVVGQLMLTFEWSDWRNGMFWWIQSVYVAPDWRRRGVFRSLYQHVVDLARSTPGICGLRLYMESANAPARSTYRDLGLRPAGYEVWEVDFGSSDSQRTHTA